ncbi:hypothetical protein ACNTMW_08285 [Planosporangium sp. 12N6]|uniref:hypothetical protein n=1 Tax=Planosporangium spinosum TaxID=3402278 RepID=UPI003CF3A30D
MEPPQPVAARDLSPAGADGPGHSRTAVARPEHRRWLVATVVVGYLLHLGWRLWLARAVVAPVGHPDEDGYLLAARALAGGPGGYSTENGPFRRVGYPLLLSPVYWWGDDAFAVFHRAQVVGAVAGALVFPLSAMFARRVLGLSAWWAVGAAFAATALPAAAYYSSMAMTDAVLPAGCLLWLLLTHGWMAATSDRYRRACAVGGGAAAGFAYTLHVRGMMIVAVHLVLVVTLLVTRRARLTAAVGSIAAATAVGALDPLLKLVLGDAVELIGANPGGQLPTAVSVGWGIALVLLRAVGQLWYLGVATLGLGALGIVATIGRFRHRPADRAERAGMLVTAAVLAVTVLVALGSAASLPFGERRVTYFAYPRYLHFLFPVWFLIGFAAMRASGLRRRLTLAGTAAGALAATAAVVGWRTAQAAGYAFAPFDAPETTLLSWQWVRFPVLVPTAVALGLFGLAVLAQVRPAAAAAVLVAVTVLGGAGMEVIQRRVVTPMVAPQYAPGTPRLVRDVRLGPGDTVAEAWQVPFPYLFNHMREVSWQRLTFFDAGAAPPPPEANVVIAPWAPEGRGPSWDGSSLGMRLVAVAPWQGWAVWRREAVGSPPPAAPR